MYCVMILCFNFFYYAAKIIGKAYYYKADEDLVPVLDNISNRNRYINDAVRKKAKRDRLL